LKSLLVI